MIKLKDLLVEFNIRNTSHNGMASSEEGVMELIRTSLRRVQFDKDMASNLLRDKSKDQQNPLHRTLYLRASEELDKMSNGDVRGLFSGVREGDHGRYAQIAGAGEFDQRTFSVNEIKKELGI